MLKEHPSLSRDFFTKIKTLYPGTLHDAAKPTFKLSPTPSLTHKPSFGEKNQYLHNFLNFFRSSITTMWESGELLDVKTVYHRTDMKVGYWSPALKIKLESYIEINSPSLVLSNESWKEFVATKDSRIEEEKEGMSKREAKLGLDITDERLVSTSSEGNPANQTNQKGGGREKQGCDEVEEICEIVTSAQLSTKKREIIQSLSSFDDPILKL